jgi:ABC-type nickel/cobalt efflux system permease component RcnA
MGYNQAMHRIRETTRQVTILALMAGVVALGCAIFGLCVWIIRAGGHEASMTGPALFMVSMLALACCGFWLARLRLRAHRERAESQAGVEAAYTAASAEARAFMRKREARPNWDTGVKKGEVPPIVHSLLAHGLMPTDKD